VDVKVSFTVRLEGAAELVRLGVETKLADLATHGTFRRYDGNTSDGSEKTIEERHARSPQSYGASCNMAIQFRAFRTRFNSISELLVRRHRLTEPLKQA
jgi:hypothetical protein